MESALRFAKWRIHWTAYTREGKGGGGGYSSEFWVRVCQPVSQILTLFQTQKCHLPHPFSDQTSKIHTRFQTWHSGRNCHHYLDKSANKNILRIHFEFAYFSLLFTHLELKR